MSRSKDVPIENRLGLTMAEACDYAGCGPEKAKRLMNAGEWKWYREGREYRILRTSIEDWALRKAEAAQKNAA